MASTEAWRRLEEILLELRPGDRVTVEHLSQQSALACDTVDLVLAALTRAGLFERDGERFTRRSLADPQQPAPDPDRET